MRRWLRGADARLASSCAVCSSPAKWLGVFAPAAPRLWGAPPGMHRLIAYRLCEPCRALPDGLDRVEAAIARDPIASAGVA